MHTRFYNFTKGETFRLSGQGFTFFNPPKEQFVKVSWQIDELVYAISDQGKLTALSHLAIVQINQKDQAEILEKIKNYKWKSSLIFDL